MGEGSQNSGSSNARRAHPFDNLPSPSSKSIGTRKYKAQCALQTKPIVGLCGRYLRAFASLHTLTVHTSGSELFLQLRAVQVQHGIEPLQQGGQSGMLELFVGG